MHMALNQDEWLKMHTEYCHRLQAWITHKACEQISKCSSTISRQGSGDSRCLGCNGLDDQPPMNHKSLCASINDALEDALRITTFDQGQEETPALSADLKTKDFNDRDGMDCIDDDELEEELLELFPELKEVKEKEDSQGSEMRGRHTPARRRYSVYLGRCQRCGGYMINDPDVSRAHRDIDVHRCLACSWRTSPMYEWNRNRKDV